MKPQALIILLVFCLTGVYAWFNIDFHTDNLVQVFMYLLIWSTGLYYFYLNLATEEAWEYKLDEPRWRKKTDGCLIVIQGIGFEALWFTILGHHLLGYAIDICILNLTYIIWDIVYWDMIKQQKGKIIITFDLLSLLISLWLSTYIPSLPAKVDTISTVHQAMWATILSAILIYHSIIGFIISATQFKTNPLKDKINKVASARLQADQQEPVEKKASNNNNT